MKRPQDGAIGAAPNEHLRLLYLMVKPSSELAAHITELPCGWVRPAELLHMTLLPLGESADLDGDVGRLLVRALDALSAPAFRVVFDRLHGDGRTLLIRGSETMRGTVNFQRTLVGALAEYDLTIAPKYAFRPHITLDYRNTARCDRAIDAISWRVEDYLLVESVHGEGRHVLLGRWPLVLS